MVDIPQKFKVVLTDPTWSELPHEEEQLGDIADLHPCNCKTEDQLISSCQDADALLVTYAPITRKVINHLKKCQAISVFAIGLDMVDVQAATDRGIPVTNVPAYCVDEVCDHAMALLLAAARKILIYHQSVVRDGLWNPRISRPVHRLRGRVLGLIGFGKIPREVAVRAMAFGLKVMVYDPYVSKADCEKAGVVKAELNELVRQADFISIHSPLTPETKGIINEERLQQMKPTTVIINTSRGPIIEEAALIKALNEKWIAGAALDVVQIEPISADNPLKTMENVILTPHAGYFSEESLAELRSTAAKEVRRVLTGQKPAHLVNPEVMKGC